MSGPATGTVLGDRYHLTSRLAVGGMGAVWRGEDSTLSRKVAVKLLHEGLLHDPDSHERFRREARAAAGLSHPNIAAVFDFGEEDGRPYLVMELLEGETLADRLRREGPLDPAEVVRIGAAVARALSAAHDAGVLHRDVKPGNVMLTPSGDVKVMDFGIAATPDSSTLTAIGSVLGTAPYLAPERIRGDRATPASDLYALGVLLYEMLAGKPPFALDTPAATAMAHLNEEPPPLRAKRPDAPPALLALVGALLEKDPASRPASAAAVAASLGPEPLTRPISTTEPESAGAAPATERLTGQPAPGPIPPEAPSTTPGEPAVPPAVPPRRSAARPGGGGRFLIVGLALAVALIAGVVAFQATRGSLERVPPASSSASPTGPEMVRVPDLRGSADEDRVRQALTAVGLDFGGFRIVTEGSTGIVGSEPSAGSLVPKGTDVVVLVHLPGDGNDNGNGKGKGKGKDKDRGNDEEGGD